MNTLLPFVGKGPTEPLVLDMEHEIFAWLKGHKDQQRPFLRWNQKLAAVARYRCEDLMARGYNAHIDPEGRGPNWWVRQYGYKLPSYYHDRDEANYVESLNMGGRGVLAEVQASWMKSDGHRRHLLGYGGTWMTQTEIGVGYCHREDSPFLKHYYCVITCPPEG